MKIVQSQQIWKGEVRSFERRMYLPDDELAEVLDAFKMIRVHARIKKVWFSRRGRRSDLCAVAFIQTAFGVTEVSLGAVRDEVRKNFLGQPDREEWKTWEGKELTVFVHGNKNLLQVTYLPDGYHFGNGVDERAISEQDALELAGV